MRELMLADGPARYLGGSIESFVLPMAAFIVIALALYLIFRRPHSVPRMKYLTPATQTSVGTREPGTTGLTVVRGSVPASPSPDSAVPDSQAAADGAVPDSAADQAEGDA